MKFSIVAAKKVRGHDGQGYNATVAADGKKVAFVDDDGWGGGLTFTPLDAKGKPTTGDVTDQPWWAELKKQAATNNEFKCPEVMLGSMVEDVLMLQSMKRSIKKATVFTLKSDPKSPYAYSVRSLNVLDPKEAEAYLSSKFPNDFIILNPLIASGDIDGLKAVLGLNKTETETEAV